MDSDLNSVMRDLAQIAAAEVTSAFQNPGTVAGTILRPYAHATVRFDSSQGVFVVSRPDGDVRTSDRMEVVMALGKSWIDDLTRLYRHDQARFAQAAQFIRSQA